MFRNSILPWSAAISLPQYATTLINAGSVPDRRKVARSDALRAQTVLLVVEELSKLAIMKGLGWLV
jgi:hypothetical protein